MSTATAADDKTLKGIVCGSQHLAWRQFEDQMKRVAGGLKRLGIGRGDCVALFLRNDITFVLASRAAGYLGAYAVPVNWHLSAAEMAYILDDSRARVLVIHADLWHTHHDAIPKGIECIVVETPADLCRAYGLDPQTCGVPPALRNWRDWLEQSDEIDVAPQSAPAAMLYTSGTTGNPKGVLRTPPTPELAKKLGELRTRVYGCRENGRFVVPGPLYHSAPNSYGMQASRVGDLLVVEPRFDAEEFLGLIDRYALTGVMMVPIMFIRLLKLPPAVRGRHDLSSMEFIVHGAAPCPADVKQAMIDWFGPVVHEYYGSTESGAVVACDSREALARPGTVGRADLLADVRILDDKGATLSAGEAGEIYTRFPGYDFTYINKPEARRAIEVDGYITSGDMGYLDADGYLYVVDRAKDMVISGGVNIYPAEIEAVLHAFRGIRDCAVFGVPDPEYGESVMAVLEPESGVDLDLDEIRKYLRQRLAGFKVPKAMEIGHDLPREDSGKIFKRRLRDQYWQRAGRRI